MLMDGANMMEGGNVFVNG